MSILSLPRDVMIYLLCFTKKTGDRILRCDAVKLYYTCKQFTWLKGLYFTLYSRCIEGLYLRTITLFDNQEGPHYSIENIDYRNDTTGFRFHKNHGLSGNHAYYSCIIRDVKANNISYDIKYQKFFSEQINSQWEKIDPELKHFVDGKLAGKDSRLMLVREKIPNNTYVILLPNEEDLK